MQRVSDVPGRDLHLLRARREDLLQEGLRASFRRQVRQMRLHLWQERLRDARQEPDIPPGVLPVRGLPAPTHTRGLLRAPGRRALLQPAPQGRQGRGDQQQQVHTQQQQQQQRGRR